PDHKVWTFRIRKGVRFSNGLPLTASDVKFSITRTLDPHLKPTVSWGQTTDPIFQGAQDFVSGKTDDHVPQNVVALQVEKGQITASGGNILAPDIEQARKNPTYARYLVPILHNLVIQLDIDVHVPPFDKLAMRQAVALAINRNHLVKLEGGFAVPG